MSTRTAVAALAICAAMAGCGGSPTDSRGGPLPLGRWTGDGACLSVADGQCDLAVGCGHGQFPRPTVRSDGTFDVDGTYRVEVGPISINPAPPAHFSGIVSDSFSTVTIRVVPTAAGLPPASYVLHPAAAGGCPIPCV